MRQLLCALVLISCSKLEKKPAGMAEKCASDEECSSGLVCVHGVEATPICLQQCGERGYGACPKGWSCSGIADIVTIGNRQKRGESRQVCLQADREMTGRPSGWWVVAEVEPKEGEIAVGTAFHFREDGYELVFADGWYDRRQSVWEEKAGIWYLVGRHRLRFDPVGTRDLAVAVGDQGLLLTPADPTRVEKLAALVKDAPDPIVVCKHATLCCDAAAEAMDATCDHKNRIGDGRFLRQCQLALEDLRRTLDERGLPRPQSCN